MAVSIQISAFNSNQLKKMIPEIIKGEVFTDFRGDLFSNNNFDMSRVKRMYIIDNINNTFVRG